MLYAIEPNAWYPNMLSHIPLYSRMLIPCAFLCVECARVRCLRHVPAPHLAADRLLNRRFE